jgi:hypothetical protein
MLWGRPNLGAKKVREKRGENSPPHIHLISSMAKSIVIVQIKDNGAQRWFGIIRSIKPGRLQGMQEEIHSLL